MTTKPFFLCLLAVLAIEGSARACQYCALAANDPEMAKLAAEMHAKSGGFPLDAAVNQFQPAAASAVLTAPPSVTSVATRAADLSATTRLPAATTHRVPPPVVPAAPTITTAAALHPHPAGTDMRAANRWANGGLLGLLGLAGFFGWRTRRSRDTL